jgi:hypothetical protein
MALISRARACVILMERVNLYGAHFPRVRARGAPSHRRRQWVPPINRSQRDHPKTERARFRLGANDGARAFGANADDAAAAGRAVQLRGYAKHAASKDQEFRGAQRVNLYGAHFPRVRARGAPSHRRRQWVPPINRSQRDHPKTERARFRLGANDGARAFGANADDAAAAGRAVQLRGYAKHAASKDQEFRGALISRARARGARRHAELGQQTDPRNNRKQGDC